MVMLHGRIPLWRSMVMLHGRIPLWRSHFYVGLLLVRVDMLWAWSGREEWWRTVNIWDFRVCSSWRRREDQKNLENVIWRIEELQWARWFWQNQLLKDLWAGLLCVCVCIYIYILGTGYPESVGALLRVLG
jgi:hypothetical protein